MTHAQDELRQKLREIEGDLNVSAITLGEIGLRGACIETRNKLHEIIAALAAPQADQQGDGYEAELSEQRRQGLLAYRDACDKIAKLAQRIGNHYTTHDALMIGGLREVADAANEIFRLARSASDLTHEPSDQQGASAVDDEEVISPRARLAYEAWYSTPPDLDGNHRPKWEAVVAALAPKDQQGASLEGGLLDRLATTLDDLLADVGGWITAADGRVYGSRELFLHIRDGAALASGASPEAVGVQPASADVVALQAEVAKLHGLLGEALPLVRIALWNDLARRIYAAIPAQEANHAG